MDVVEMRLETLRLAALHHQGDYADIGKTFDKLTAWLEEHDLAHAPRIAIYHDDPHNTPQEQLRSEACAVLDDNDQVNGEVHETTIPAGRYAMASFAGPFSELPNAWVKFYTEGLQKAGLRTTAGPCFERYLDTAHDETSPDDPITELYAPLAD